MRWRWSPRIRTIRSLAGAQRRLPYVEQRDGVRVVRLPLWVGKASTLERYRQELTFMASLAAAAPFTGRPDVLVSTSPAFLALASGHGCRARAEAAVGALAARSAA